MATSWQRVLARALEDADVVAVYTVARRHLGRRPTRSEATSIRRAARLYAESGKGQLAHARVTGPHGNRAMLFLGRRDADLRDEHLVDVAIGRPTARGRPLSDALEVEIVDRIVRRIAATSRQARTALVDQIRPDDAADLAGDLAEPLRDLERLRQRLATRGAANE